MRLTTTHRLGALLVFAALAVGACGVPGTGGDDDEAEAVATTTTAVTVTTLPQEEDVVAQSIGAAVDEWSCGRIKEVLYGYVTIMASFADQIESPPLEPDENDAWTSEDLREAMRVSAQGFTSSDQTALNSACELVGQHDAAIELWTAGDRGDACDVWLPAHSSAQTPSFDVAELHPMAAHMWIAATGSVAQGHGRCIAERAN